MIILTPLILSACGTVRPQPMTAAEHADRARADHATLMEGHKALTGPLTLEEAVARALKYNYDAELTRIEQTLQERQIDLAMMQMLPRLAANAGYSWRNNDNAAESIDEQTKLRSLDYSYSEERQRASASLQFSWNALDVGVGYYQAKQQGWRALVAVERRRKVIDNIVKGVQEAYWKAAVAQELLPRMEPLIAASQKMLEASRASAQQRLQPLAQALEYQQNVLEILSQLRHMKNEMVTSQIRLATLINTPIDAPIRISESAESKLKRPGAVDIAALEETSLNLRPELREAAYQEKIDRQDVNKEIIKMLPGIGVLGSLNYDSNKLLYNNTWGELGVRATYNLVSLIEGPKAIEAAEAAVEVAKARRIALAVAVLTQVNLGLQEYRNALDDLDTATELDRLQRQLSSIATSEAAADATPETAKVRRELAAMAADFERGRSLADAYTALANLYVATGIDLVSPNVDIADLPKLTEAVSESIRPWTRGELPKPVARAAAAPQAAVTPPAAPVVAAPVVAAVETPAPAPAVSREVMQAHLVPLTAPAPKKHAAEKCHTAGHCQTHSAKNGADKRPAVVADKTNG
jgi:outer membrane protein TolC